LGVEKNDSTEERAQLPDKVLDLLPERIVLDMDEHDRDVVDLDHGIVSEVREKNFLAPDTYLIADAAIKLIHFLASIIAG